MQKLFTTFLCLCIASLSKATIHVVSNLPGVTANFTNLSDAAAAAQSGDTIYVQPSATAYPNFQYLDKKIIFLGAGFFLSILITGLLSRLLALMLTFPI